MSLKRNLTANFTGSAWTALMSIVFVPFYLELMGPESYGIVGIYTSLIAILAVMDMGLSQTMNREMARLSHEENNNQKICNTAKTLEIIYWIIAVVIGLLVFFLAKPITDVWLNPEKLTSEDIQFAIQVIGLVIALRWPVSLYIGGLNGLQKQISVNVLLCIITTFQGLGALAVLWFIEPTIKAFFIWQAFVAVIYITVFKYTLWRYLPIGTKGAWDKNVLSNIWRFSAGLSGITILATILTQLDKVLLSKILTLTDFGYYTFATTVAAFTFRLVGPVFTAYYPRLTQIVARNDHEALVKIYHQGSQIMSVVLLPISIVLVFFSEQILMIWTGNQSLVANTSLLVSLIIIGNTLNGIMHMPYALQLAHAWTKLALYQNIVAVILLLPAIYYSTKVWGAVGAVVCWIILNALYLLIGNHIMHLKLLKKEKWLWYYKDLIKPLAVIISINISANYFLQDLMTNKLQTTFIIIIIFCLSTVAALLTFKWGREITFNLKKSY